MSLEETRSNFAWKVLDGEGLGYAITDYFGDISNEELEDPELVADWAKAREILGRIQGKLEEWQEGEDDGS